jgi:hypothetical protein
VHCGCDKILLPNDRPCIHRCQMNILDGVLLLPLLNMGLWLHGHGHVRGSASELLLLPPPGSVMVEVNVVPSTGITRSDSVNASHG